MQKPQNCRTMFLLWLCLIVVSVGPPPTIRATAGAPLNEAGSAQVAIYLTRADASGAVFELDDLKSDPHAVVSDLTSPESVVLGRDRRLYFTEIYVNAADGSRVHRIQRLESDNTKTLIAQWPIDELRPSGLLFSPNGDLWIGTTSVTGGAPTKGV